jgi:hypothetical protein
MHGCPPHRPGSIQMRWSNCSRFMTPTLPQNTSPASPGFGVRTSGGANIVAALRTAVELGPESRVVTILCDRAERYYSTKLFAN